jgi:hypothetical protein
MGGLTRVRRCYGILTAHEHRMVKHLSKMGNSSALVLDRTLMDLVDLTPGGAVDIQV